MPEQASTESRPPPRLRVRFAMTPPIEEKPCVSCGKAYGQFSDEGRLSLQMKKQKRSVLVSDHIYKKIELVGSSATGIEDAVNNAVKCAAKTVRNMRWFEVSEIRGHIADNKIDHWQVSVKVGFTLDA